MKTIYDLKLHESMWDKNIRITRVPGGWIYQFCKAIRRFKEDETEYKPINSVFVPFNAEFRPRIPEELR